LPKVTARKVWKAEVELEIERLALSCQYVEKGQGSSKKRFLVATDWLDKDKQTIVWDSGKRLKGWLKQQIATMKSSWKDRIQYGIICKSTPQAGYVPTANIKDIEPSRNWHSFQHAEDYDLNGLPEPNIEVIMTEQKRSIFAMYYVLNKQIKVKVEIYSYAYGIYPEIVEEWLRTLGSIHGLGDMHNSSEGFGCFKVLDFKVVEEKKLNF